MLYSRLCLVDQGGVLIGAPGRCIERQGHLVAGEPPKSRHGTHQRRFGQSLWHQWDVSRAPCGMQHEAPRIRIKRDLDTLLGDCRTDPVLRATQANRPIGV